MLTAQRVINTSHGDNHWYILFRTEYQITHTQMSERCMLQNGIKSERQQKQYGRLYVCMFVCLYVCMFVCMYVCMYVYYIHKSLDNGNGAL